MIYGKWRETVAILSATDELHWQKGTAESGNQPGKEQQTQYKSKEQCKMYESLLQIKPQQCGALLQ